MREDVVWQVAKEKGFIDVMMNSNATALTKKMGKALLDVGLDNLFVSFDAVSLNLFEQQRVGTSIGKSIANGFSVSALVGRKEIMEIGGIRHDKKRVFLISTTHGAENHGLAALQAKLAVYREENVVGHLWAIGGKVIEGLNAIAAELGIGSHFRTFGFPCSPYFDCRDRADKPSLPLRALFLQEMIAGGVIINYRAPSYSHGDAEVALTLEAARKSLAVYARALDEGHEKLLHGPAVKPLFRPYN